MTSLATEITGARAGRVHVNAEKITVTVKPEDVVPFEQHDGVCTIQTKSERVIGHVVEQGRTLVISGLTQGGRSMFVPFSEIQPYETRGLHSATAAGQ